MLLLAGQYAISHLLGKVCAFEESTQIIGYSLKLKKLDEDITDESEHVSDCSVVNRFIRPREACAGCETNLQSLLLWKRSLAIKALWRYRLWSLQARAPSP